MRRAKRAAGLRAGALGLAAAIACAMAPDAGAQAPGAGSVSGLPVPRFVSLKSDKVNVRRGPTTQHQVAWEFLREGLPVEIVAEYDNWRRIRDADGDEGWVYHSLLSGRRTALVSPWAADEVQDLRARGDSEARVVARLQARVLANVGPCDGAWCRLSGRGFEGWIEQEKLWGVYPGEKVE